MNGRLPFLNVNPPPPLKGGFYETRLYHKRSSKNALFNVQSSPPIKTKQNATRSMFKTARIVSSTIPNKFDSMDLVLQIPRSSGYHLGPKRYLPLGGRTSLVPQTMATISLSNVCSVGLSSWEKQGVPCV